MILYYGTRDPRRFRRRGLRGPGGGGAKRRAAAEPRGKAEAAAPRSRAGCGFAPRNLDADFSGWAAQVAASAAHGGPVPEPPGTAFRLHLASPHPPHPTPPTHTHSPWPAPRPAIRAASPGAPSASPRPFRPAPRAPPAGPEKRGVVKVIWGISQLASLTAT